MLTCYNSVPGGEAEYGAHVVVVCLVGVAAAVALPCVGLKAGPQGGEQRPQYLPDHRADRQVTAGLEDYIEYTAAGI
jgi:hypothetical protein